MGIFDSLVKLVRPQPLAVRPTKVLSGLPSIINGTLDPDNPWYMSSDPHVAYLPDYLSGPSMLYTSIRATDGLMCTMVARLVKNSVGSSTWVREKSPVIEASNNGWDGEAIETPCFVKGVVNGKEVHRIYYMGRPRSEPSMPPLRASIGFAEWNPSTFKWVKRPIPVIMPTQSWESIPNVGYALGDQSVVYDEVMRKWYCIYHASAPTGKVVLGYAESDDGIVWSNKQIVNWAPTSISAAYPYGPYHLSASIINGKWYFVGWVGKSSTPYRGLWITTSSGPLKKSVKDFSNWQALLYEDSVAWATSNSSYPQDLGNHQIGLFSAQLFNHGNDLQLFFHTVTKTADGTGNVADIGSATLPSKVYDL